MVLSIVIPIYNAENFVRRCVHSLMSQEMDLRDFEILLINDGSTDDSYNILEDLKIKHPNVRVFHKMNSGTGDTRNFGIDRACGKYIYFLDMDDYVADNTIKILIDTMEKENLEILCFQSVKTYSATHLETLSKTSDVDLVIPVMDGFSYIAKYGFEFEIWRFISNTEFLKDLGLRYESDKVLEDAFFTVRLFIAAKRMGKIQLDVHRYMQEPTSTLHRLNKEHEIKILKDLENLALQYNDLIVEYQDIQHPEKESFLKILRNKVQFFVFYNIIRSYKIDMRFSELWAMLKRMKKIGGYPFTHLIDSANKDPLTEKLQFIFNRKLLLYFFVKSSGPILWIKSNFQSRARVG